MASATNTGSISSALSSRQMVPIIFGCPGSSSRVYIWFNSSSSLVVSTVEVWSFCLCVCCPGCFSFFSLTLRSCYSTSFHATRNLTSPFGYHLNSCRVPIRLVTDIWPSRNIFFLSSCWIMFRHHVAMLKKHELRKSSFAGLRKECWSQGLFGGTCSFYFVQSTSAFLISVCDSCNANTVAFESCSV